MIPKIPISKVKRFIGRTAAVLFVAEFVSFLASYKVWDKLNSEREFRLYMRDSYPSVLETYYYFGETLNKTNNTRAIDYAYWNSVINQQD